MNIENRLEKLRKEYLSNVRRYESGDKNIGILDVLKFNFGYYFLSSFLSSREYFKTLVNERIKRRAS